MLTRSIGIELFYIFVSLPIYFSLFGLIFIFLSINHIQGGSNMTGTDLCVRLCKSVPVIFEPPCIWFWLKLWSSLSDAVVVSSIVSALCFTQCSKSTTL